MSPLEVLKERTKLLRKMAYSVDEDIKEKLSHKNTGDNLEQELSYCSELIDFISKYEIISNYPKMKMREPVTNLPIHHSLVIRAISE